MNSGYDQKGNLQTVEDVGGRYWTYEYTIADPHALMTAVRLQGILYASAGYDSGHRAISYMEDAQSWTIEYQAEKTFKRDASGNEWEFFYDAAGVITKRVDPLDRERLYTYGASYRLESTTEEDGGRWEYADGGMGRIGAITRRFGENSWTWNITYDTQHQFEPKSIVGPAGWGGLGFQYDPEGNVSEVRRIQRDNQTEELLYSIERNPNGEVTAIMDASTARTEYEYDGYGRLTTLRLPANNAQGVRQVYGLGYDPANRVNSLTDPLTRSVSAVYDPLDRVTLVTLPDPGTGASGFVMGWTYDQLVEGRFKTCRSPNSDMSFEGAGIGTNSVVARLADRCGWVK